MLSGIRYIFGYINTGIQILGAILIGFKMVVGHSIISIIKVIEKQYSYNYDKSLSDMRFLAAQEVISIILHTIIIILAVMAANLATKDSSSRRQSAIILLAITQGLIGIVVVFNIAGAAKYRDSDYPTLNILDYYVLSLMTILYLSFVFLYQIAYIFVLIVTRVE